MEGLLFCGKCDQQLKDPKTLRCLHSFCLKCLLQLQPDVEDDYIRCATCGERTLVPEKGGIMGLETNYFVQNVLKAETSEKGSTFEKNQGLRNTTCLKHPDLKVDLYCNKCKEVICAKCGTDLHNGHEIVAINEKASASKDYLRQTVNETKNRNLEVEGSVKSLNNILDTLDLQNNEAEKEIEKEFDKLRDMLNERQAEMLNELEKAKFQKVKALKLQRDELEMIKVGIDSATSLTEKVIAEGTEVEILISENQLTQRLIHLKEAKLQLIPAHNPRLKFFPNQSQDISTDLKHFGMINSYVISAEQSFLEGHRHKQPLWIKSSILKFKIIGMNYQGEPMKDGGTLFDVEIKGPAQTLAQFIDCLDGTYDVVWTPDQVGNYEILVTLYGNHVHGSPFNIKAYDKTEIFPGVPASLLVKWLPEKTRYELLYSYKRDGPSAAAFIANCTNQGPTITIVSLKNGAIFGGYASASWFISEAKYEVREAKDSFLFSVTDGTSRKPFQCKIIRGKEGEAISYNAGGWGPRFGGGMSSP